MSDDTTKKMYSVRPTEYLVLGTHRPMWLVNANQDEENQWVIKAGMAKGNYYYDPGVKRWVLASHEHLDVEAISRPLDECRRIVEEAELNLPDFN